MSQCRLSKYGEITGSVATVNEQIAAEPIEVTLWSAKVILKEHSKHGNRAERDPEIEDAGWVRVWIGNINGNGVRVRPRESWLSNRWVNKIN